MKSALSFCSPLLTEVTGVGSNPDLPPDQDRPELCLPSYPLAVPFEKAARRP